MKLEICNLCHKNKTALKCDSCADVSCKSCVIFVDEDCFEMITLLPEDIQNKTFCMNCFNQGISEKLNHYAEVLEKAKQVNVFSKVQTKETSRIKRVEKPLYALNCSDKEEALMKIAFMAAEKGFETIVDVELKSQKVGEGKAYKKLIWSGSGIPVDRSVKK